MAVRKKVPVAKNSPFNWAAKKIRGWKLSEAAQARMEKAAKALLKAVFMMIIGKYSKKKVEAAFKKYTKTVAKEATDDLKDKMGF